eukprot:scaffold29568_cov54-Attheya_sp.AAC.4
MSPRIQRGWWGDRDRYGRCQRRGGGACRPMHPCIPPYSPKRVDCPGRVDKIGQDRIRPWYPGESRRCARLHNP